MRTAIATITFIYDESRGEVDRLKRIITGGFNHYTKVSSIMKEIVEVGVEDVGSVVPSNTKFETPLGVIDVLEHFEREYRPKP